jgi:hypothetical protein
MENCLYYCSCIFPLIFASVLQFKQTVKDLRVSPSSTFCLPYWHSLCCTMAQGSYCDEEETKVSRQHGLVFCCREMQFSSIPHPQRTKCYHYLGNKRLLLHLLSCEC